MILIDIVGNIALGTAKARSADVLGHVFEYGGWNRFIRIMCGSIGSWLNVIINEWVKRVALPLQIKESSQNPP